VIDSHTNHAHDCKKIKYDAISEFFMAGLVKLNEFEEQIMELIE
jgi:hypothetical protein